MCGSGVGRVVVKESIVEVVSYIKSLLYSLSYVEFYNHINSSVPVSLQAGGCYIKKKS